MAVVLRALAKSYSYYYYDLRDKRTDDFLLVNTPLPVLGLLGLYYYFVTDFGPRFMKDRPAFNLKKIIIVYNVGQILLNAHIFFQAAKHISRLNPWCSPVDYSDDEFALFSLNMAWLYLVTKLIDLLDTVFFVLRKKNNQVSFLHLYHHILMCLVVTFGVRYVGGGHSLFLGILNTFVHIWMYGYYLLSAYDSSYKKNIWWKKYITILQITQFFVLLLLFIPPAIDAKCTYPKPLVWALIPQNLLMVILFSKFYYHAYIKPKSKDT